MESPEGNLILYFILRTSLLFYFVFVVGILPFMGFFGGEMGLEARKWCCDKTKVVSAVCNTVAMLCPSVPKVLRPRPQKWSLGI